MSLPWLCERHESGEGTPQGASLEARKLMSWYGHRISALCWQFLNPELPESGPEKPPVHLLALVGLSILAMTKVYQGKILTVFFPVLLTCFRNAEQSL